MALLVRAAARRCCSQTKAIRRPVQNLLLQPPLLSYSSSSSSSTTTTMRLPFLLSLAAALTWQSRSAFADSDSDDSFRNDCPFYGCVLLPQDIHYNTDRFKQALGQLRQVPRRNADTNSNEFLRTSGTTYAVTLTLIGYKGGSLSEQINQDRAVVIPNFTVGGDVVGTLLGVFDGHAPQGELVSEYTKNELPNLLSLKLSKELEVTDDEDRTVEHIRSILTEVFIELDRTAPAEESGGCTCTIVLQHGTKIYIANAGDSRSFLVSYRPSTAKANVLYMTREDKPDLPDEKARVEAMGGQVYIPVRGTPRVVYHDPRTGAPSGLAMSRSIGDWAAGKLGVIPDPIVDVFDIRELVDMEVAVNPVTGYMVSAEGNVLGINDDVHIFAVSATDGMMDYLEAVDIAAVLAKALYDENGAHPITAVEHLVLSAANAWQQDKHGRYRDDIAIAVSTIRRPPSAKGSSDKKEALPQ